MSKFIFVTGGVVSGIGKGVVAASIGLLMKARGLTVAALKLDPYLNVDPGTMSPYQHGEVFVTADGAETDLDLGHYERFIGNDLSTLSSVTSGQIYADLLNEERLGEKYLGGTIQVVPHVTNQIKESIYKAVEDSHPDVVLVEIGGTVGDIEGLPFLEAIRQLYSEIGPSNSLYVHVTLLPFLQSSKELKTKPTQHSVRVLRSNGQPPDVIVLRSDYPIQSDILDKVARHCDVTRNAVIPLETSETHYSVPLALESSGMGRWMEDHFRLRYIQSPGVELTRLQEYVQTYTTVTEPVTVGLVGKYTSLEDAYMSVKESLVHAAVALERQLDLRWIDSELLEQGDPASYLEDLDAIVVPGGFGQRGVEGKIWAAAYARQHHVPYLGLCLGMQVMCIELARSVSELKEANSTEFDLHTPHPVIDLMPDQREVSELGGTMRRGNYPCVLQPESLVLQAYRTLGYSDIVHERHRHRYEFNNKYRDILAKHGLGYTGMSPDGRLVEIVELVTHPFMVGCQFHPEFQSRPTQPHPLFLGFMEAAVMRSRQGPVQEVEMFVSCQSLSETPEELETLS